MHDTAFHDLIADVQHDLVVLTDTEFHAKDGDPANMKPCKRGTCSAHGHRNGAVHVDHGVSLQAHQPPHLGILHGAAGLYYGSIHCAGAEGRLAT